MKFEVEMTESRIETISLSNRSDVQLPSLKAKQTWQKLSKTIDATRRLRKVLPMDTQSQDYDNSHHSFLRTLSCAKERISQRTASEISEFKYADGIPIKDSDKDTFSRGIATRLVINPEGNNLVIWLGLITIGFMYFAWSLIARQAFSQLREAISWEPSDYIFDVIFLFDIFIQSLTGFLEDGLLVTDVRRVVKRYIKSRWFILDVICLLPVPFITSASSLWRFPRLLKIFRAKEFIRKLEWAIPYPTLLRVAILVHTLMLLMHWFACFYFMVSESEEIVEGGTRGWAYPFTVNNSEWSTLQRKYLHSLYWSCLTLTTIGEKQSPSTDVEYLCTMAAYFLGIFVFATVVGQVGNVIALRNENKQAYQSMMDHAKKFMTSKSIPKSMQQRVLRWYRFSRSRGTLTGDNDVNSLQMVPDSLKTELAIYVNLNTLRKVSIFQLVQPEFLHHLVLKMKSCIYTPNDLVCRYGEVGREMFIVNHGFLEVISEAGAIVARLKTGDFFGEIGVLNLNEGVNKRVASVRSVGYSEVFILSADDILQAMEYYPEAKQLLHLYGRKRFQETEKRAKWQTGENNSKRARVEHVRETSTPRSKKDRRFLIHATEMLVSSTATAIESEAMKKVFPIPKEEFVEKEKKVKPAEKKELLPAEQNKSVDNVSQLNDLVQELSEIVAQYRRRASTSGEQISRQEKIIKEQQKEIKRLNADIKLLMNKLDNENDW